MTAVIDGLPTHRHPRLQGALSRLTNRAAAVARDTAERLSGSLLTVAGLGCIDVGAFEAHPIAGWVVTGVSVLAFDWVRE